MKEAGKIMAELQIHQFSYLSDNYGFLLHDPASGQVAAIDAGDASAYLAALDKPGYQLSHIFITHHHYDHIDGLAELKQATGATIIGPSDTKSGLAAMIDEPVSDNDSFTFANHTVQVIATPGHTLDMMNYYLPDEQIIFTGDTLFTLGCGRLFEGDGPMMWHSLSKLRALPAKTMIYSAHEYSLANAAFALSVDPDNQALKNRAADIQASRDKGQPTVPSCLADECATNPFLRPDDTAIRRHLDMEDASDEAVFTKIRALKDAF